MMYIVQIEIFTQYYYPIAKHIQTTPSAFSNAWYAAKLPLMEG